MLGVIKGELIAKIVTFVFLLYSLLWLYLTIFQEPASIWHDVFNNLYGTIALLGGVFGLIISRRWGGFQSWVGRSIIFFSLGLLAQEFGQLSYNYYRYVLKFEETPYPSIGDIGFLGYIPLYMFGMYSIAKVSGVKVSLRKTSAKLLAIATPIVIGGLSYMFFLEGYTYDWSNPFLIVFDLGYPLGQALNISVLIVTYILSRNILGGIMRPKIIFLIIAFMVQYLADFNFLYQINRGVWNYSGTGDYLYMVAYFLMSLGLIQLKVIFDKLKSKTE